MFDFSFGELAVIGTVALVVLGPERLPKVARTVGEWVGKAQRYVSQVKSDINREMELAELKKLQEEARQAAQSVKSSLNEVSSDLTSLESEISKGTGSDSRSGRDDADRLRVGRGGRNLAEQRLSQALQTGSLGRRGGRGTGAPEAAMAMPTAHAGVHRKYAPRARVNRPRIRR